MTSVSVTKRAKEFELKNKTKMNKKFGEKQKHEEIVIRKRPKDSEKIRNKSSIIRDRISTRKVEGEFKK